MSKLVKAQITEVHNVMNTLVETANHLETLTQAVEVKQSLYIFSSLIEGIEAVFKVVSKFDINVLDDMKVIETTLPKMASAFENDSLEQVAELINTSLLPALINMRDLYEKALTRIK